MYEFLDYRVCDAMTVNAVTVKESTTLAEAEALFEEHDFNALPVVDGKRLLGVVTKLDLLKAFRFTDESMFPPYEQIMARPVSHVMTRDVVTVNPRTPLTRVLEKMVDLRTKSLPVTAGDELVGVIAREDLLRALRRAVSGERANGAI
jgi:CBS domain-containing protein